MGVPGARTGEALRRLKRLLRDERGVAFLAPLLPFISAILPSLGAWAVKTAASIATPVMIVLLLAMALRALGGDSGEMFFNLPSRPDAPPLFLGLYEREIWDKLITPGAAAFWTLGGLVAILAIILTGYDWYHSSVNPRTRASLMETLWQWVLGALALGLFPLWASFLLGANDRIVQALGRGLPDTVSFKFQEVFVLAMGEEGQGAIATFIKNFLSSPGDLMAAAVVALAGQGVILYFTIFFLIRKVVLVLLLWTGPILGGAVLFHRRGAGVAGRYWLELLSAVFVQSLLALCAVFALSLIAALAGGADNVKGGNVSLASQVAMLAAMMAMMPATNLLRTILGLPVGGIGLAAGIGAGMIGGFALLLGQAFQRLGGLALPIPPAPVGGGAGPPPPPNSGSPPALPSGGGAALAPVPASGLALASAPAATGIVQAGAEHVRRAREAARLIPGRFEFRPFQEQSVLAAPAPPPAPPPGWDVPSIDRPRIRELRNAAAAGGALAGALSAGFMAMGMGNPGLAMFMAPAIGEALGARVGAGAAGTPAGLYKVTQPTARVAAPIWKLVPELRRAVTGSPGSRLRRIGPDVWGAWRIGQILVGGWRPGMPRHVAPHLVARNWWVPVGEAFGIRFHETGAARHRSNPPGPPPGGTNPLLVGAMMDHAMHHSYYSPDWGEIRLGK